MAARAPWLASLSLHSHSHSAAATSFLIPCLRPRQVYASGQLKQCWFHSGFIGDACGSVLGVPVPDFAGFQSQSSRRRQWRNTGLATKAAAKGEAVTGLKNGGDIRVRFAPSPTGNLHVGGARTALFNYLFAKSQGGKFILRIEDTDLERSTRESEEAVLRDLKWLGLQWDEGPDNGGDYGPYRQSERNSIYRQYAEQLLESGHVYRCFCSDEELEAMREEAKADNRPPKYSGKWATANRDDVDAELAKGTSHTFRFRVPQSGTVTINDLIRGEVSWSKDTLGDFVILRSNGQPVYNFCVAVDDSSMKISHVIRAEEHLPNTLRQALIYEALGFPMPRFGHVSLILARDRSKLSKRHGATSVGQFKEMGYLPQAMVNYLALLGWNDGTEEEIFTIDEIINKFSIDRITKSAAIFDQTKLSWMNGQHLKAIPQEDLVNAFGAQWVKAGILTETQGPFVNDLVELLKSGVELVPASEAALLDLLSYPLHSSLASAEAKELLDDNLKEVAEAVIAAYDSGELQAAIDGGHEAWQKWIKGLGKTFKRKGKRLFMPVRIALTGRMHGPDIGAAVAAIPKAERSNLIKVDSFVPLHQRISILREVNWDEVSAAASPAGTAVETEAVLTH